MSNVFYNVYSKKSTEELKNITSDDSYTDEVKACAISILRERNVSVKEFQKVEEDLGQKGQIRIERKHTSVYKYNTGFYRFIALIIDGFVISVATSILERLGKVEDIFIINFVNFIVLLLPYLYTVLMHGCCGQTVGKMFMGVKLFDKDEKSEITYIQALIRDIVPLSFVLLSYVTSFFIIQETSFVFTVMIFVGLIAMFWSMLEIITLVFDEKRRALHDFLAKTIVLKIN